MISLLGWLILAGCSTPVSPGPAPPGAIAACWDVDEDGWCKEVDCRDYDEAVYPGAPEIWYNGVDDDCDGASDFDADGDGFDAGEPPLSAKEPVPDCDDANAASFPGAPLVCGNGFDDNCDGRDECSLRGSFAVAPLSVFRRVGGYPLGAGDFDGDGDDDWIIEDDAGALLLLAPIPEVDFGAVLLGSVPNGEKRAWGDVGGGVADDVVTEGYAGLHLVYLDPGLSSVPELVVDSGGGGSSAVSLGDVTGDASGDLVVDGSLVIYVFPGPLTGNLGPADAVAELSTTQDHTHFGLMIEASSDVTADGVADVVVGLDAGDALAVFPGPLGATMSSVDVPNIGSKADPLRTVTEFIDSSWDWNQDGAGDLMVETEDGQRLYFGPLNADRAVDQSEAHILESSQIGAPEFPSAPRPCGDLNADGWPDLCAASMARPSNASILYGPFEGAYPWWLGADVLLMPDDGWGIETAVGVGDANGDGADDLLLTSTIDPAGRVSDLVLGLPLSGF